MSNLLIVSLLFASAALPQDTSKTTPEEQTKRSSTPVSLTGCVDAKRGPAREITFSDAATGSRYRLTGKGLDKFLGARVEIVGGGTNKGLSIRGGLFPSPNIAAQGGGVDPAQESIARQRGGAASSAGEVLREFPVTRIRALGGACG